MWASAPLELEQVRERLARHAADFAAGREYIMAITDRGTGEVHGGAGLHRRRGPNALEVGYWLRTTSQGQGFATEATAALTRWAFEAHPIRQVQLRCDPNNLASVRLAQRLGYVHRTTLKQIFEMPDGRWCDSAIYSIRRDDWGPKHVAWRPLESG